MIRDITIGQYYPAQSPIHKLDPRVKLFATLIYIIAVSYTHLRAHETDSYLVCRLLLEKKKKTKTNKKKKQKTHT